MKVVPTIVLKSHMEAQELVAIIRDEIDENELSGFILDFDDDWLLLQKEYDFLLDGYHVIRRSDITSVRHGETQKFHKRLFQIEGKMEQLDFAARLPEGGVMQLAVELAKDKVVIAEDEINGDFLIGFVEGVEDGDLLIHFFDGEGKFEEELRYIEEDEITKFSFDTSYCLHYERYFKRKGLN